MIVYLTIVKCAAEMSDCAMGEGLVSASMVCGCGAEPLRLSGAVTSSEL